MEDLPKCQISSLVKYRQNQNITRVQLIGSEQLTRVNLTETQS